jgi:DNA mismatch endonuclease, patch repair protein
MQANRRADTGPELALRRALRAIGMRGYRCNLPGLPGRPDVAFTRPRVAIFVHGCFWHRCPHCHPALPKSNRAFWRRKFQMNAERDERKRRQLEASGWTVLEVWECEVEHDAAASARRVQAVIVRMNDARAEAQEETSLVRMRSRRANRGGRGRA